MIEEKLSDWKPICVASTEDSDGDDRKPGYTVTSAKSQDHQSGNYFKGAEWSPDGTTLLTDSADHHIRTFILSVVPFMLSIRQANDSRPRDLLDEKPSPHRLSPYSTLPSVEPTYDTAIYPFYSLQDPSTTLFLSSSRDHPIKLTSALAPTSLANYSLINPTTEAFITPHSIIYPPTLGGTHFLTGSDSLICLFDISRFGSDGAVSWMPTIPSKRRQMVGGGVGMKGIISAMAVNPVGDGILAAGTFTRQIGLYGSNGSGESLGTFSIAKTEATRQIGGRGVTQVEWSPCGRYLYVAERKSDGVLVYDIRVTGQLLGWLQGRKALTNQRMKVDVVPSGEGDSHELWAGGTDGYMRVWRNPTHTIGGQDPDWEWKVHDDSVASTVFHPMGTVAATCSGQRHYFDDEAGDGESRDTSMKADNTLKIWSLPFLGTPSDG